MNPLKELCLLFLLGIGVLLCSCYQREPSGESTYFGMPCQQVDKVYLNNDRVVGYIVNYKGNEYFLNTFGGIVKIDK